MATIPDKLDGSSREFAKKVGELLPKALPEGYSLATKPDPDLAQDGDLDFILNTPYKGSNKVNIPEGGYTIKSDRQLFKEDDRIPFSRSSPPHKHGKWEEEADQSGNIGVEASFGKVKTFLKNNLPDSSSSQESSTEGSSSKIMLAVPVLAGLIILSQVK